ncbi:MAG TPA: flagellar basal body rod C-terminal domain-containing protein [Acetobacteraceae bacterium]|nr:flagellar basal body rod C-terminal domain-containing protein [Acetobacteraceae bacterium]
MITLDAALSIANSGLANVNRRMGLVSQNVANAGTPGYAAEIGTQWSLTAEGTGLGVHTGPAIRSVDTYLQSELFTQNATVAGLQTQQTALTSIDGVMGTPGQGGDIASLLGQLQDQFSTLLNSPDSAPQQQQVVSAATTLAQGINTLSDAYTSQRQAAEDSIATELASLNTTLATIGGLSDKIIALKAGGQSTADLENQRDAALANLSQLVDIKALEQPNGDMLIATTAGLVLPTRGDSSPFAMTDANVQPGSYYPGGGIQPITLAGADVTTQLRGGQIGANITLRDTTLPTDQAELDEFAQNLASRFTGAGLTLFTDPSGNVLPSNPNQTPPNGYVGFAATIQVSSAVQADPSLVRDGDNPPVPAPAGNTSIIQSVLTCTFGTDQPSGAAWPAANTRNLGPTGRLNAPYVAPPTLTGLATTLLASQAQTSAAITAQVDTEQAVQTTLSGKLSTQSGVNIDTEMSNMIQLQNAYGANAKVISTVQAMWTQLLQVV